MKQQYGYKSENMPQTQVPVTRKVMYIPLFIPAMNYICQFKWQRNKGEQPMHSCFKNRLQLTSDTVPTGC